MKLAVAAWNRRPAEDALREALPRIEAWAKAYPLDLFPEPEWAEVKRLLGDDLLTRVSAANMRHVATKLWEYLASARALLEGK